jgi:hypothetical protein
MIHAREKDFDAVKDIFKQHKEWFGFIRRDYIKSMLINNANKFDYEISLDTKHQSNNYLIFEDDVIITYAINKTAHKLGKFPNVCNVDTYKGDVILHQIGAKNRNGSASRVLQKFFKEHRRVFLSVHSSNKIAKKFYEKNGMNLVGYTTFAKAKIPGDIYFYDGVEEVL